MQRQGNFGTHTAMITVTYENGKVGYNFIAELPDKDNDYKGRVLEIFELGKVEETLLGAISAGALIFNCKEGAVEVAEAMVGNRDGTDPDEGKIKDAKITIFKVGLTAEEDN